ncbi:hypothetical protein PHYPSEUDO_011756 [Phytophthora pseudosyringae]|uniref:Uncharacterized protein n=1 Tax=Phytophthora pseudosyringae TaxID=221518 RepID=A0A8T1V8L6_9STRA|nr:hypothetical protein PHYPSEUDO_011756 [Phytophthora pseudosyringae]
MDDRGGEESRAPFTPLVRHNDLLSVNGGEEVYVAAGPFFIRGAKVAILVMVYIFTLKALGNALLAARARCVNAKDRLWKARLAARQATAEGETAAAGGTAAAAGEAAASEGAAAGGTAAAAGEAAASEGAAAAGKVKRSSSPKRQSLS